MNHEFPINHAAAIARLRITNAHVLHFRITNAEEREKRWREMCPNKELQPCNLS